MKIEKLKKLVLFDIDGTLIWTDGAGRRALAKAMLEIYGTTGILNDYDFSGKTDPQIVVESLLGIFPDKIIKRKLPETLMCYLKELRKNLSTKTEKMQILPGIVGLLEKLKVQDDVLVGLLTGNLKTGAKIKLESFNLSKYFIFGAFSSDSIYREDLPQIAVKRAYQICGRLFSGKDIVIIGDSIYDVQCGRSLNVKSIAVASGLTNYTTLAQEYPDYLFENLSDTEVVIQSIME